MELDFSGFRDLFNNSDFFYFVLPLLFFTTMTFTVLEFVTKQAGNKLPLNQKTNIIISLIFGFLATNNEKAVNFLLNHFNWVILLIVFAYVYLIFQKIAPNIDYIPLLVILSLVVLMLNDSIMYDNNSFSSGNSTNWIFALFLFFAILWAVYKSKE
ncbi:MAG: hypothetical protein KAI55_01070 [Candidatus Aenigmarchaeota archaeon]|nr:hypothetical protein [Candidatus Aenigmarchaeota archaeon]